MNKEDENAIQKLSDYLKKGYLTQEEFDKKKNDIMSK
jgi:predicted Zn-dependent peptidase